MVDLTAVWFAVELDTDCLTAFVKRLHWNHKALL